MECKTGFTPPEGIFLMHKSPMTAFKPGEDPCLIKCLKDYNDYRQQHTRTPISLRPTYMLNRVTRGQPQGLATTFGSRI